MILPIAELTGLAERFMWPFARVSALLLAAPMFGTHLVTVRVRVALAVLLTWTLLPVLPPTPVLETLSLAGLLVLAQQVLIGLAMGFAVQLVFNALIVAGESMAMSMGLGFASLIDPQNGVSVPVLSQFFVILATLVFLTVDGHLVLIEVLADSFAVLPVGTGALGRDSYWAIAAWGSEMLIGAVRIALPVVVAVLIAYLGLGVMTRAAPQLNVFSVGFPAILLFGFLVLLFSMPSFVPAFTALLDGGLQLISAVLGT